MEFIHAALLIVGGILALSAFIVAKKPDARAAIEKLVPYQAFIGVGLLAIGVVQLVRMGPVTMFRLLSFNALFGLTWIAAVFGAIILGFFFGMPQIAKWLPGQSNAETKAMQLSQKLAPYQMIFGFVALIAGILLLLYRLNLLKLL